MRTPPLSGRSPTVSPPCFAHQHDVHKLIEPAEHARHLAIGIQRDCDGIIKARTVSSGEYSVKGRKQ